MLLRALLLAVLAIAGCTADEPHGDVTEDSHFNFDDCFTEADLQEVEKLVKSWTSDPILQQKVTSPVSVEVRCGKPGHGGQFLVLKKDRGNWCYENFGNWGAICPSGNFGHADALDAISHSSDR